MGNYSITKDFSKAWQYRSSTKSASLDRKSLKQKHNRRVRRVFKQSGRVVKPTTGWDVV